MILQGCADRRVKPRRFVNEVIEPEVPVAGVRGMAAVKTFDIYGDGNCLFRAVVQWYDDPTRTKRYVPKSGLPWRNPDKVWENEQAGFNVLVVSFWL